MAKENIGGFWKWFWIALAGVILAMIWYVVITFGLASYYEKEGNSFYYKEKYEEAIKAYRNSLEYNADNSGVYNSLGYTYYMLYDDDKAMKAYHKALEINPKNENVYFNMGTIFDKNKKYDKALENYNKVLNIVGEDYNTYMVMAYIYQEKNEYDKALEYFEKVKKINPENNNILNNIGILYSQMGDFSKAREYLLKYIASNPEGEYVGYVNLFELDLTLNRAVNEELEAKFIKYFSEDDDAMVSYEMLKAFESITQGVEGRVETWDKEYKDVSLGHWGFGEIEQWISTYEDEAIKTKLMKALVIVKAHKND